MLRVFGNSVMLSDGLSDRQRYSAAATAAALVTAFLLFVMTQLITPIGGDPAVERMLLRLETINLPPDPPSGIRASEPLPESTSDAASESLDVETDLPTRPERAEDDVGAIESEPEPESESNNVIDWWAQTQDVARSMGNEELEAWLQSPAFEDWVSVMQGPMPSSGEVRRPVEDDPVWSIYRNVFGDVEIRISEDCVLQIHSDPFDYSSFAKNIPPNILCKEKPVIDMSGLEEYIRNGRAQ